MILHPDDRQRAYSAAYKAIGLNGYEVAAMRYRNAVDAAFRAVGIEPHGTPPERNDTGATVKP